jgi:D-arabinose 1-dehydrogenase-like Zn-dependent alcohol dehydrogenase
MIPRRSVQHARRNAFVVQPKGPKIEGSRGYDVPRACETPGCSKRFPAAKSPRLELCPQPPSVKLATKPIAVDVDDAKLELAKQLGAALAVNARKADPAAFVKKEVGGAQGVLVTAVSPKAFEQALGIVGRGGTVSLNGLPPGDFPVSIFDTVINGITVRGSIVGTRLDLQEALNFAGEGKVKATITMEKLENINDIFARMHHSDVQGRIVIDF